MTTLSMIQTRQVHRKVDDRKYKNTYLKASVLGNESWDYDTGTVTMSGLLEQNVPNRESIRKTQWDSPQLCSDKSVSKSFELHRDAQLTMLDLTEHTCM